MVDGALCSYSGWARNEAGMHGLGLDFGDWDGVGITMSTGLEL